MQYYLNYFEKLHANIYTKHIITLKISQKTLKNKLLLNINKLYQKKNRFETENNIYFL